MSASTQDRLAMLNIALADERGMVSDDIEVKRQGPSYTILTLEQLREQSPDANLLLIVGADSMHSFHKWHRYRDILALANIVVMRRPDYELTPPVTMQPYVVDCKVELSAAAAGKVLIYEAPEIHISATKIRNLLKNQQSIQGLVPESVERYIAGKQLYCD